MALIPGYPEGSDITLLNTIYLRPHKDETTDRYTKGSMTIIFRDNVTGEKKQYTMDNPTYEYYVAVKNQTEYNRLFANVEDLEKREVPYIDLEKHIAEDTNNMEFYKAYAYSQDRYRLRELHQNPNIFNSDSNIEDQMRSRFARDYTNNTYELAKCYLDIEADTIHMKGDFPEPGECPINAVTIICQAQNEVYTLLLRDDKNQLAKDFENSVATNSEDLQTELKLFIQDTVGGWKEEHRFGIKDFHYNFRFYDEQDEIFLIADIFNIINTFQPDFVLAWNMAFDIPYIIQRIVNLGYNPTEIMCNRDFTYPVVRYFIDERSKNDYAERGDFATIASYSVFLDQMIHFASRRKGRGTYTSYKLDFIGETVAKVKKLDYSHITTNIAELPRKDYKTFVFYNIMDTIVQKCIEAKTEDLEYVFGKCNMNNTRYHKCHRQTVYLANRAAKEFNKSGGFIIGNNVNKSNQKGDKFPGAFVADPSKLNSYSKMHIDGHIIDILNNTVDFDYASLYPSILREFNMAPNTQIGMLRIAQTIWSGENRRQSTTYTRGGEFIENIQSKVYLEFCKRWLHLGGFTEVYDDIIEYFATMANTARPIQYWTLEGSVIPFRVQGVKGLVQPYTISDEKLIRPYTIYKPKSEETKKKIGEVLHDAQYVPKQIFLYESEQDSSTDDSGSVQRDEDESL